MTTIYQCVTFHHNVLGKSFYSLCGCPSISVRPQRKCIFEMYFPFSCLIRLQLIFSSFDAFLARKTFVPSNGEILVRHVRRIFATGFFQNILTAIIGITCTILISRVTIQNLKFSSRACLRFGIVTDDKNWIS